jgi:hypothetical protein
MAGEFLNWILACTVENHAAAIPPKSEASQLPMNELMEPCLLPDIDIVPIDSVTMDYDEDGVTLIEGAQTKYIAAVEDEMNVSYQDLISGSEPFTVLAIYEDDHGNYKSQTRQTLAFTRGDYFAHETAFPLKYLNTDVGHSPDVPSGGWLTCRARYTWSSCSENDWEEHAEMDLDYFAGGNDDPSSVPWNSNQSYYTGEYFAASDDASTLCSEASEGDWGLFEEVYNDGGEGTEGLNYSRDDFILTDAEDSFAGHFDAISKGAKSLATEVLNDASGDPIENFLYGAYYCENNLCYDVEFE